MKRAVGRPTRAQQEENTTRVLDAARAAFCRHGMAGVSMDRIAADAGVTKHTIYRRYDSKEQLLDAVCERELSRLGKFSQLPTATERSPLDRLRILAHARHAYSSEPETIAWRAFLRAESTFTPTLMQKLAQWDRVASAPFLEAIGDSQNAGYLAPGDPDIVCDVLFSLVEGGERWWRWGTETLPAQRDRSRFFQDRWSLFVKACSD